MRFLKVFVTSFILVVIFFFFGGYALFSPEHIWRFFITVSLIITVLALIFLSMSDEIDGLRKRIEALENMKKTEEGSGGQQAEAKES